MCLFPEYKASSEKTDGTHIFADEMTPSISQERGGGSDERSHKSISKKMIAKWNKGIAA